MRTHRSCTFLILIAALVLAAGCDTTEPKPPPEEKPPPEGVAFKIFRGWRDSTLIDSVFVPQTDAFDLAANAAQTTEPIPVELDYLRMEPIPSQFGGERTLLGSVFYTGDFHSQKEDKPILFGVSFNFGRLDSYNYPLFSNFSGTRYLFTVEGATKNFPDTVGVRYTGGTGHPRQENVVFRDSVRFAAGSSHRIPQEQTVHYTNSRDRRLTIVAERRNISQRFISAYAFSSFAGDTPGWRVNRLPRLDDDAYPPYGPEVTTPDPKSKHEYYFFLLELSE